MKNEIKIFEYKNTPVTFQFGQGEDVMINATEMAKVFGKRPVDYLKTQSASELVNAISKVKNVTLDDIVTVIHGGSNNGTWMEETVALDFAQWLSVDFKLWCLGRIKEILTKQQLELPKTFSEALMLAAKQAEKLELQEAKLKEQRPDVLFSKSVKRNGSDCLVGELAKIICQNGVVVGQNRLFEWLRDSGYLMKEGRQKNIPKQQYIESGLFRIAKGEIETKRGNIIITSTTMVTPKGQHYFVNKYIEDTDF